MRPRDRRVVRVPFGLTGEMVPVPTVIVTGIAHAETMMMTRGKLLALAATLVATPWAAGLFLVEIGAYVGSTSVFLARALRALGRRVTIVSIDPFERARPAASQPQGVLSLYLRTIATHEAGDACVPIIADSARAAAIVADRIGLLVIDGGHRYHEVRADLALYAPKVVPGGFIFMDDYRSKHRGVRRAADEYFSSQNGFRVVHRDDVLIATRNTAPAMPPARGGSR